MARRLYLGHLPAEARQEDVQKLFDGYGPVIDCRVMAGKGFGFVEFENSRDAEDVVQAFNGKTFMGTSIVVEFAKEARRREPRDDDRGYGPPVRSRRPPGFRVIVSGISRDTSWQDLKDFGREGGSVSFADIDRDNPGDGILDYVTREDADNAVKTLDGRDLRGSSVHVALYDERDNRDDRTRERYRGSGYGRDERYSRDDRYSRNDRGSRYETGYRDRYDDRYRDPRSHRSRSPRRSDYDRRGGRTPPKRDYDERRMEVDDRRYDDRARYENGRDDRRGGRDDDRVSSRRRDEAGTFEDKRPVENTEASWAR